MDTKKEKRKGKAKNNIEITYSNTATLTNMN